MSHKAYAAEVIMTIVGGAIVLIFSSKLWEVIHVIFTKLRS